VAFFVSTKKSQVVLNLLSAINFTPESRATLKAPPLGLDTASSIAEDELRRRSSASHDV
jgi:hypothetical protein